MENNSKDTSALGPNPPKMNFLFEVTTFSKILSAIVFITLPFAGFYIGTKFTINSLCLLPSDSATTQNPINTTPAQETSDLIGQDEDSLPDTATYNFDHMIMEVFGDLNEDGLSDKVVVTQDTIHENAPYKLEIFFKDKNEQYNLIVSSVKIIYPQYPNGRDYGSDESFPDITIKEGVLGMQFWLIRGYHEYKFRFQDEHFELINFSYSESNGRGEARDMNFDLTTGVRIKKSENYETGEVLSDTKETIMIRPLPKLQDVGELFFLKLIE